MFDHRKRFIINHYLTTTFCKFNNASNFGFLYDYFTKNGSVKYSFVNQLKSNPTSIDTNEYEVHDL